MPEAPHIIVIGAGVAGLVSALVLSARGFRVSVLERAGQPGGKMREVAVADTRLDAGPTVFTMRWVFDELFAAIGEQLDDHLVLQPVEILARHAWSEHERLDLFADRERAADAIGVFAGAAEARRYRQFCADARRTYQALEQPFMRSAQPSPAGLIRSAGLSGLGKLLKIRPFDSLWRALGDYFHDPRLRQLFGRYATYCGSSPFQAPATLMLVAHVEQEGVWLVQGGMHRVAQTLARLAKQRGASLHYDAEVSEIIVSGGRAGGVKLASGEQLDADAVIVNADVAALAAGHLGAAVTAAVAAVPSSLRSLSALTWNLVARCEGFPLLRHTVFFSNNYSAEFDDIFKRSQLPVAPTVYICAQDRDDHTGGSEPGPPERLLCLVNAPACGDTHQFSPQEITQCEQSTFHLLEHCGLYLARKDNASVITTPNDFERLFPGSGGALYGQASHGWKTSFSRPGARSRIAGLYLAGGSTHPGPGVPMAALSGRLAAAAVLADFKVLPG